MADPSAAAVEPSRCVKELGFVGALVDNHRDGRFYDDEFFWPVFAMAEQLDVPFYIHPTYASSKTAEVFKDNYSKATEDLLGMAAWGWHSDCGLHVLKLYASGVFDKYPKLKLVIGHMGEMMPYMLERILGIDELGIFGKHEAGLKEVWDRNIWVTTSGMFSLNPMACLVRNTRKDRILFSVDYPFSMRAEGRKFMEELRGSGLVTDEEWMGIGWKNAENLLGVKVVYNA